VIQFLRDLTVVVSIMLMLSVMIQVRATIRDIDRDIENYYRHDIQQSLSLRLHNFTNECSFMFLHRHIHTI
jgi:hypothetical protein